MINQEQLTKILDQFEALTAKNALYKARCEQYAEAYEYLKDQILELARIQLRNAK